MYSQITVLQEVFEDPVTGWYEGTAILLAVLLVTCVTAGNNYSQEKVCCMVFAELAAQ